MARKRLPHLIRAVPELTGRRLSRQQLSRITELSTRWDAQHDHVVLFKRHQLASALKATVKITFTAITTSSYHRLADQEQRWRPQRNVSVLVVGAGIALVSH